MAGLLCRLVVFRGPHVEGDEVIYRTLVEQLDHGRGYNLVGASFAGVPIIGGNWPADQYGRALFFHPPGGVGFFWLMHRVFGELGFPLAQVLSYALFYWSMLALARAALGPLGREGLHWCAVLTAFTPIMTHVTQRYWLDGPMLALSTLAGALLLQAVAARSMRRALVAGVAMAAASWIKTSAFVALPGLLALAWAAARPGEWRFVARLGMAFTAIALLLQLPWELWQWVAVGSPFPAWAGKPSSELVASNRYVYFLTVVRPPWIYLTLAPRVLWTLGPASVAATCLAVVRPNSAARRTAAALGFWIAMVLAMGIALGAIGYSKLMRYVILVTPATVLLATLAAGEARRWIRERAAARQHSGLGWALLALLGCGLALEVGQGMYTPILDSGRAEIIRPILWAGDLSH